MKKSIHFTEHLLIPLVLALLNIGIVHLIYLLAHQRLQIDGSISVALALVLMAAGIISKNKWLLLGSIVYYVAACLLGI